MKSVNTWGIGLISTNREGTKRYFHFDGVGSTVALTEDTGGVTDTYVYSAFGVLESSTGSSVNPFRYIGQFGYYDDTARGSNSGLLLLGVRYYSPSRGTFISWDPISSANRYNYVNGNPSGSIDPSGRISAIVLGAAFLSFALDPVLVQLSSSAVLASGDAVSAAFKVDSRNCFERCNDTYNENRPTAEDILDDIRYPSIGLGPGMPSGNACFDKGLLLINIFGDSFLNGLEWLLCIARCTFLPVLTGNEGSCGQPSHRGRGEFGEWPKF